MAKAEAQFIAARKLLQQIDMDVINLERAIRDPERDSGWKELDRASLDIAKKIQKLLAREMAKALKEIEKHVAEVAGIHE